MACIQSNVLCLPHVQVVFRCSDKNFFVVEVYLHFMNGVIRLQLNTNLTFLEKVDFIAILNVNPYAVILQHNQESLWYF